MSAFDFASDGVSRGRVTGFQLAAAETLQAKADGLQSMMSEVQ